MSSSIVRCESGSHEMNQCSVAKWSNMTLTDEIFRNKVCFRFVLQGRPSNLAITKWTSHS
jgi:hypothetical protein